MKIRKLFLIVLILITKIPSLYSEDITNFLGIEFGQNRTNVSMNMIKQGWKIDSSSDKQIIFSGGDINYESLLIFDKVSLFFTDKGLFYQVKIVLFDRDKNVRNIETYVTETIKNNNLNQLSVTKNKKTYCSSDGFIFSYQLQDDGKFPFLIVEKGQPTILKTEVDAYNELESLNPKLCTLLQTGQGKDFYYIITDASSSDYNALYLSKTNDFSNVVYLCLLPDPSGLQIANMIDREKNSIYLVDLLDNVPMKSFHVSWCSKLIYFENE